MHKNLISIHNSLMNGLDTSAPLEIPRVFTVLVKAKQDKSTVIHRFSLKFIT